MRFYLSQWLALALLPSIAAAAPVAVPAMDWQDWLGGLFVLSCVFYTVLHVFWSLVPRGLRFLKHRVAKSPRPDGDKPGSTRNA
jgi:hypothetical protein